MANNIVELILKGTDASSKALQSSIKNLVSMDSALGSLKGQLAGLVSAGALIGLAKQAIDLGSTLSDMSKKFGVSASELSALSYVAKMNGVELEGVGNAMKFLSKSIAESEDPASEAARAFKVLGISKKDLEGKTTSEVFDLLADRFAGLKDGANKTALALAIFGRSGADVLPMMEKGAAGIKEMKDRAVELGVALSEEEIKKLDEYGDAIDEVGMKAKTAAGRLLIYMGSMANKANEFWYTSPMDAYLKRQGFAWGKLSGIMVPPPPPEPEEEAGSLAAANAAVEAAKRAATEMAKINEQFRKTDLAGWGAYAEAIDQENFSMAKSLSGLMTSRAAEEAALLQRGVDSEVAAAEAKVQANMEAATQLAEITKSRFDLEQQYADALGRGDSGSAIDILNEGLAEQIRLTEEAQNAGSAYMDVYREGMRSAEDMAISVGMGLRDGLVNTLTDVITGAQSLGEAMKDLGKSILDMLAETLVKWVVNRAIMSVMGKTFALADLKAMAPIAEAHAAMWAPAATLASLATLGSNSVGAIGGMGATLGTALSIAAMTPSFAGIAHGGLEFVPAESTFLLDRGERVLSSKQNEDLTKWLAGGEKKASGDSLTINLYMDEAIVCRTVQRGIRSGRLDLRLA